MARDYPVAPFIRPPEAGRPVTDCQSLDDPTRASVVKDKVAG